MRTIYRKQIFVPVLAIAIASSLIGYKFFLGRPKFDPSSRGCVYPVQSRSSSLRAKLAGWFFSPSTTTPMWTQYITFPTNSPDSRTIVQAIEDPRNEHLIVVGTGKRYHYTCLGIFSWVKVYDKNKTYLWGIDFPEDSRCAMNDPIPSITLAVDSLENVYVAGNTLSSIEDHGYDTWIKKYNASGVEDTAWNLTLNMSVVFEAPNAMEVDPQGRLLVAGSYDSFEQPVDSPPNLNGWIRRIDTTGNLDPGFAKNIDLGDFEAIHTLTISNDGLIAVAGTGQNLVASSTGSDIFVHKYQSNGTEVSGYPIYLDGGSLVSGAHSIDVPNRLRFDDSGNLYLVASASSISSQTSGRDGWAMKLTPGGSIAWQRKDSNANALDSYEDITKPDTNGHVWIFGSVDRSQSHQTGKDLWLKRVRASDGVGVNTWFYNGTGGNDAASSIIAKAAGGFYLVGTIEKPHAQIPFNAGWIKPLTSAGVPQTDWPYIAGTHSADVVVAGGVSDPNGGMVIAGHGRDIVSLGSTGDIWLAKLSPSGSFVWRREYDLGGNENATAIVRDPSSNFYVLGQKDSNTLIAKFDSSGTPSAGSWPLVLTLGDGPSAPVSAAVDSSGNLYVLGVARNLREAGSGNDWFIKKFDPSGSEIINGWNKVVDSGTGDSPGAIDVGISVCAGGSLVDLAKGEKGQATKSDWYVPCYNSNGRPEVAGGKIERYGDHLLGRDTVTALKTDHEGNLYIAGTSENLASSSSGKDAWVRKYDVNGTEVTTGWPVIFDVNSIDTLSILSRSVTGVILGGSTHFDSGQIKSWYRKVNLAGGTEAQAVFDLGGNTNVRDIQLLSSGELLATGVTRGTTPELQSWVIRLE